MLERAIYISTLSCPHTFTSPVKLFLFCFFEGGTARSRANSVRGVCVCACVYLSVDRYLTRMHRLLVVTSALVALCSLGSVDSSAYDKIVGHSRIRARNEG